ncbi:hypothetical protein PYCCODRAFT_95595 [Trametes coccinea BRFM310]|uniref:Uncharacterized protein n=1 Tax=Trametes coccinea (strain BRFM310) TaxID=1353009 RepID=A0A1Y2ITE7_TRAC3|nr:hypothetical protein PYCCODRAFT_95595 [Trametes coccinea BRFM310]
MNDSHGLSNRSRASSMAQLASTGRYSALLVLLSDRAWQAAYSTPPCTSHCTSSRAPLPSSPPARRTAPSFALPLRASTVLRPVPSTPPSMWPPLPPASSGGSCSPNSFLEQQSTYRPRAHDRGHRPRRIWPSPYPRLRPVRFVTLSYRTPSTASR